MFPLLYHAHHIRHPDDLPFWLDLAVKQGDPVLELGCGTGRVLIPLARAGHLVYGIDHDAGMLSLLQANLPPSLLPNAHIVQADMTAFHLAMYFPLIILPCNTLSALPKADRRQTQALVHHHLRPGGLFAASLPNPTRLAALPAHADPKVEEIFPHPSDGEPVQVSSAWERTAQNFIVTWHYDHLLPDGKVERVTAQASHELVTVEAYLDEMRTVGLEPEVLYGDYAGTPYTANSTYAIILARKPS